MSKTDAEALIAEFEDATTRLATARAEMMTAGAKAFKAYIPHVFKKHEDLDIIIIRGWTPGFNDGDPCTHHMDVLITGDDFLDNGDEEEALELADTLGIEEVKVESKEGETEDDAEYEANTKRIEKINGTLAKDVVREISETLRSFDDVLEAERGTNWKLTYTRNKNGSIHCEEDDYWCGH